MPALFEPPSDHDYRILGLEPEAPAAQVKLAFRELAKRWHPDRFHHRPLAERERAEATFKEITGAYRRITKSWKTPPSSTAPAKAPSTPPRQASGQKRTAHRPKTAAPAPKNIKASFAWWNRLSWNPRFVAIAVTSLLAVLTLVSILMPERWPAHQPMPVTPQEAPWRSSQNGDQPPPPEASPEAPPSVPPPDGTLLAPPAPTDAPFFSIGSTPAEVLRVQGPPERVHGQTWTYGLSEVQFRDGQVWRYNNFDGSLRVHLEPAEDGAPPPEHFSLGATPDEVLRVQGTPTRIEGNKWYFGFSSVRFKAGHLEDYDNYFGNLRVRLLPENTSEAAAQQGYFTVGSTRDDVLAVQGTPTSIQGNFWFYRLSNILFRDGRVQAVVNAEGNLRFMPAEEPLTPARQSG